MYIFVFMLPFFETTVMKILEKTYLFSPSAFLGEKADQNFSLDQDCSTYFSSTYRLFDMFLFIYRFVLS